MIIEAFEQLKVCSQWDAGYVPIYDYPKIGLAEKVNDRLSPINGLRHPPIGEISGWYIWFGNELSQDDDFFQTVHAKHLDEICPEIEKYLGLAPGWRFLLAPDYVDVWFDKSLLT